MTAAIISHKAYMLCSDFDWSLAFHQFPQETTNLVGAWVDVQNDPYCGFGQNPPHPQTGYLSLAYLSFSLLKRAKGMTTLGDYSGVERSHNIPDRAMIDTWVNDYLQHTTQAAPVGHFDSQGRNQIIQLCNMFIDYAI